MMNHILWDCHMHSSFSSDSPTSMEDMILEGGSLTAWVHRMPLKALLGFIFFVNF